MKYNASDAAIQRAAQTGAALIESLGGPRGAAGELEQTLLIKVTLTHDTGRTYSAPTQTNIDRVTSGQRAAAMGGASSEAASYPPCPNGPQGTPESLAARRMATHVAADALRAAGLPTRRQLRNMARNARR